MQFRNAELAAATIPSAELLAGARGGHLVLAVEQPAIPARILAHIAVHTDAESTPRR